MRFYLENPHVNFISDHRSKVLPSDVSQLLFHLIRLSGIPKLHKPSNMPYKLMQILSCSS